MKTYRYKIVNSPKDIGEAKLNEFGRRGYELVSVTESEFGIRYYFKVEN